MNVLIYVEKKMAIKAAGRVRSLADESCILADS